MQHREKCRKILVFLSNLRFEVPTLNYSFFCQKLFMSFSFLSNYYMHFFDATL